MLGFSKWFPASRAERDASGDPRPSIEERYASRDEYRSLVERDAWRLEEQGYILATDLELVVDNALARYDAAIAGDFPPDGQ
jgi:hypothetical protein